MILQKITRHSRFLRLDYLNLTDISRRAEHLSLISLESLILELLSFPYRVRISGDEMLLFNHFSVRVGLFLPEKFISLVCIAFSRPGTYLCFVFSSVVALIATPGI